MSKEFSEVYPVPVDGLNAPAPISLSVSFETGEQGAYRLYSPAKIRIKRIYGIVTKAIGATDNGTILIKDGAGVTVATLTATASDALGVLYDSGILSTVTNDISKDSFFEAVTSKTTAGGKVLLSVEYNILPA